MASEHNDHALHEAHATDEHDDGMMEFSWREGNTVDDEDDELNILAEDAAETLAQMTSTEESATLATGYAMQTLGRPLDSEVEEEKKFGKATARDFLPEDSVGATSRWSYDLNEYQADDQGFGQAFTKNVKNRKAHFAAPANSKKGVNIRIGYMLKSTKSWLSMYGVRAEWEPAILEVANLDRVFGDPKTKKDLLRMARTVLYFLEYAVTHEVAMDDIRNLSLMGLRLPWVAKDVATPTKMGEETLVMAVDEAGVVAQYVAVVGAS
ncbi:hypothetical protein JG688_00009175 [Phytophthora aleatoria]|uniref:Uncharacterized protein n=1 Tax=Phytophthora aleatoria TaxID=2496075 RepID=A0A8J5IXK0_9STRA|nr:hypothetical protein JG688_00009175 [Phytophthora aleatoria]